MDFCTICEGCGGRDCGSCEHFAYFAPKPELRRYFRRREDAGTGGCLWETAGEALEPTATVRIGAHYYCPYCGGFAFPIGDPAEENPYRKTRIIGHCCLCDGARAELDYKQKRRVLLSLHARQLRLLEERYAPELTFRTRDLLTIKHLKDRDCRKKLEQGSDNFFSRRDEFLQSFPIEP